MTTVCNKIATVEYNPGRRTIFLPVLTLEIRLLRGPGVTHKAARNDYGMHTNSVQCFVCIPRGQSNAHGISKRYFIA